MTKKGNNNSTITSKQRFLMPLTIAVLSFLSAFILKHHQKQNAESVPPESTTTTNDCRLYLAPSSIPNAGLGIYTSVPLSPHDPINPSDLVLRILDFELHNGYQPSITSNFFGRDYVWNTDKISGTGAGVEKEAQRVKSLVPGLGMLTNSHLGLVNMKIGTVPTPTRMDLHRGLNPGAGSYTPYYGIHHYATRSIGAGEELFVDYGEDWFRKRTKIFGLSGVPLAEHYKKADGIVSSVLGFMEQHGVDPKGMLAEGIWTMIRSGNATNPEAQTLVSNVFKTMDDTTNPTGTDNNNISDLLSKNLPILLQSHHFTDQHIRTALPLHSSSLVQTSQVGTARNSLPNSIRSLSFLRTYGSCLDTIQSGFSTLPEAGRGAFATRSIPNGGIVAVAPTLRIDDASIFEMYDLVEGDKATYGTPRKVGDIKVVRQLLVNYCYGHRDSTLLLFPYSSVVNFINHRKHKPNVRIQWSKAPYNRMEWTERTPEDLRDNEPVVTGLVMEFVAIGPIKAGEEVFLDYGDEWDVAWRKHVEQWEPPGGREGGYVPAGEMNRRMVTIVTAFGEEGGGGEDSGSEESFPPNIEVVCRYDYDGILSRSENDQGSFFSSVFSSSNSGRGNDGALSSVSFYPTESEKLEMIRIAQPWVRKKGIFTRTNSLHPCRVLLKQQSDDEETESYLALISHRDEPLGKPMERLVKNIPRAAILFRNKPYTSDQQLLNAFRYAIAIPDDMFPHSWKNK